MFQHLSFFLSFSLFIRHFSISIFSAPDELVGEDDDEEEKSKFGNSNAVAVCVRITHIRMHTHLSIFASSISI